MRIEEERGLSPSQAMFRDGMYCYFFNPLFFCVYFVVVFFPLFFFKQAVQSTFRMEEIYHSVAQQLDEERRRRIAAVQTMSVAEKSNADLKEKLKTEEQQRKSAEAALKGVETQAESQRKLANDIKG